MAKRADQLNEGDWFGDPHRAPYETGTLRPAKVVEVHEPRSDGDVFLTLDDNTTGGPWVASYPADMVTDAAADPTSSGG